MNPNPQTQYNTNCIFVEYYIPEISDKAMKFVHRIWNTYCFMEKRQLTFTCCGYEDDVLVVMDSLREEFNIYPFRMLLGEEAMKEAMK